MPGEFRDVQNNGDIEAGSCGMRRSLSDWFKKTRGKSIQAEEFLCANHRGREEDGKSISI